MAMVRVNLPNGLRGMSTLMPAAMHMARWELDQSWTWFTIGTTLLGKPARRHLPKRLMRPRYARQS